MAPEVFMNSEGHGRAADVWSLGCVIVEMSSGDVNILTSCISITTSVLLNFFSSTISKVQVIYANLNHCHSLLQRPWAEFDSNYQIMFKVGMGETPSVPDSLSDEGHQFVDICLQHDPKRRAAAQDLLHHTFVKVSLCTQNRS